MGRSRRCSHIFPPALHALFNKFKGYLLSQELSQFDNNWSNPKGMAVWWGWLLLTIADNCRINIVGWSLVAAVWGVRILHWTSWLVSTFIICSGPGDQVVSMLDLTRRIVSSMVILNFVRLHRLSGWKYEIEDEFQRSLATNILETLTFWINRDQP